MSPSIAFLSLCWVGMSSSLFTCSMKAGLCRPVSMYHYLLQDLLKTPPFSKSILQPIKLIVFMMAIGVSQSAIEIKRFVVNREEEKADKLAAAALRFLNYLFFVCFDFNKEEYVNFFID
jgi:hypothetical protein